jgi:hypothetical protein
MDNGRDPGTGGISGLPRPYYFNLTGAFHNGKNPQ